MRVTSVSHTTRLLDTADEHAQLGRVEAQQTLYLYKYKYHELLPYGRNPFGEETLMLLWQGRSALLAGHTFAIKNDQDECIHERSYYCPKSKVRAQSALYRLVVQSASQWYRKETQRQLNASPSRKSQVQAA